MVTKPIVSTNIDGNIFMVLGAARAALRTANTPRTTIDEMTNRVHSSRSYDEALQVIIDYVDFGSPEVEEESKKPCYHCGEEVPISDLQEGYCYHCYRNWYAANDNGELEGEDE